MVRTRKVKDDICFGGFFFEEVAVFKRAGDGVDGWVGGGEGGAAGGGADQACYGGGPGWVGSENGVEDGAAEIACLDE